MIARGRYDVVVGTLAIALQVLLAAVFATAGAAKLADRPGSQQSLVGFGVAPEFAPTLSIALPLAEIATAAALVLRPSARWGAVAALVLLLLFIAGISRALRHGTTPDCNCFGQLHSAPAGRGTLIRNAVLAVLAVVLVGHGPGPALDAWIRARSAAELVAVALGVGVGGLAAFCWRLWSERGELRRDLEQLRRATAVLPPGLPVGTPAPDFELRDLSDQPVTLARMRARGLPVLLTFVSPTCSGCELLFPDLARWERSLADRITIAVISRGSPHDNRPAVDKYGLVNVMLDSDDEVMIGYRLTHSPTAVLVTASGEIGSEPAVSDPAISALIRVALRDEAPRREPQLEVIPPGRAPEAVAGLGLDPVSG